MEKIAAVTIILSVTIVSVIGSVTALMINGNEGIESLREYFVTNVANAEQIDAIQEQLDKVQSQINVLTGQEPKPMKSSSVIINSETISPGCEDSFSCFYPYHAKVDVGQKFTWINSDKSAHSIVTGTPSDGPDGIINSGLFASKKTFSHTFSESGEYSYYCMVHPWMEGKITVS